MSLSALQILHDVVIPGFNYFVKKFGEAFLKATGLPSIGHAPTGDPVRDHENFKEDIGVLLDHNTELVQCIKDVLVTPRDQVSKQTAGDYISNPSSLKMLFDVLSPNPQDPLPIIFDRAELLNRCRAKEKRFFAARNKPLTDPERLIQIKGDLVYGVFGYKKGSPPGNGTLDNENKGFEFCLFVQILAYLAANRYAFNDATSSGNFKSGQREALKASARQFGFCKDAVENLPDIGLELIKPKEYSINSPTDFHCEYIRGGEVYLKWDLPTSRCDSIILERKLSTFREDRWDILIYRKKRNDWKDSRNMDKGEKFIYRIRSVYKKELANDGPRLEVWIPDEPKIDESYWNDDGVKLKWTPARNSCKTLLFCCEGSAPRVKQGRPADSRTIFLKRLEETEYKDNRDIQPGKEYLYRLVAEYEDGSFSEGSVVMVDIPRAPDAPRNVDAEYRFDEKTGKGKVIIKVKHGDDSKGVRYQVLRYEYSRGHVDLNTEVCIQQELTRLSCSDQEAEDAKRYIYRIVPVRKGIRGRWTDSKPVDVLPGVWGLESKRADRRIEFRYETHLSINDNDVWIRRGEGGHKPQDVHDGRRIRASRYGAIDSGLNNGRAYNYIIVCRYTIQGDTLWSKPQRVDGLIPRIEPQPVTLSARVDGDRVVCALGVSPTGRLVVVRVSNRPAYKRGVKMSIREIENLGMEIPVKARTAIDSNPNPNQPFYIVFTVWEEERYALAGEYRKCAYVPDIEELKWFIVEGGIRLRWKWPGYCDTAIVLLENGSYPGDPSVEKDDQNNITWKYRDQTINLVERAAYVEDGDSYFLPIDPTSGHWHVKVHAIVRDIASSGESKGCKCKIPSQSRIQLDYSVYRKRDKIVLEWRVDPPCERFKFIVIGSTTGVPTDTKFGKKLFPLDSQEQWPSPDNSGAYPIKGGGIIRWSRDIPPQYSGKDVYCRLFIDPSDSLSPFIDIRHPEGVLFPIKKKTFFRRTHVSQSRISSQYHLRCQRFILCPYCYEKFGWWELKFRDVQGQERQLVWWKKILALIFIWRGAPDSVLRAPGLKKVCPKYCNEVRENSRKVIDLDNSLFLCPSLHIGLLGTVGVGKSHWVFSTSRRLISFGLNTIDHDTNKQLETMHKRVVQKKLRLYETTVEDTIMKPLLFEASWNHGNRRMVLALCDVDGETWTKFGKAGKATHTRYLRTSKGLVFIVDPLQISSVRRSLGSSLPEDAPKNEECESQQKPLENLINALKKGGATPKFKTPIAVTISKADVLYKSEATLRESLWSAPSYHPGGKRPAYSIALHWNVQFAVREFLRRYEPGLVDKIENNFENFAYFLVAPTGCSAKGGEPKKFSRFAPWRVEEPILWLFYQLGVIPSS